MPNALLFPQPQPAPGGRRRPLSERARHPGMGRPLRPRPGRALPEAEPDPAHPDPGGGGGQPLWEADAIACRLSQLTGSDFWRQGSDLPDMIRWISWGKETFVRACDMVQFERGTKQRYHIGPRSRRRGETRRGHRQFHEAAPILDAHLASRDWLTGTTPLLRRLPHGDLPALQRCHAPAPAPTTPPRRLVRPAGGDSRLVRPVPGLDAPDLPPIPA
jgi:glutathione S-transferase